MLKRGNPDTSTAPLPMGYTSMRYTSNHLYTVILPAMYASV
jgi:hypothetical protein